jgi:hypothetical protein
MMIAMERFASLRMRNMARTHAGIRIADKREERVEYYPRRGWRDLTSRKQCLVPVVVSGSIQVSGRAVGEWYLLA